MRPSPRPSPARGEGDTTPQAVLAVDPGRWKCGVAVVRRAETGFETLHQAIVDCARIKAALAKLASEFSIGAIVIGNGTGSGEIVNVAEGLRIAPVEVVDEKDTTLLGRKRFFAENPPRGLRKLIPISLQTPSRPHDDYVAVILAEAYLSR